MVSLLRCICPGLRCAGTEVSVTEKPDVVASAVKEAVDVPLPPFEQSLVAVGRVSDEAAAKKVTFLFCTQHVCCIASKVLYESHGVGVWLCSEGTVEELRCSNLETDIMTLTMFGTCHFIQSAFVQVILLTFGMPFQVKLSDIQG
jgi:hypothetical protein